jgi:hypothetical protein
MTWRRFCVLLHGLSPQSWWSLLGRSDPSKPKVITGRDVDAHFAQFARRKAPA